MANNVEKGLQINKKQLKYFEVLPDYDDKGDRFYRLIFHFKSGQILKAELDQKGYQKFRKSYEESQA